MSVIWERVDELIDRSPTPDDLRSHRLELLAARHFRATGRHVPAEFVADERFSAIASMTAPIILERVTSALGGPAVVLKGPEVAAYYPEPSLRSFGDIDLLVANADDAQASLLRAGFEPIGDPALYVDLHHLRPLRVDGLPLAIEIHSEPKWVDGLRPPSTAELFESAAPGTSGIRNMLRLRPEQHALILAAHSWAHEPLRRLRDLVDVAAVAERADRSEIDRLACAWGIERVWRTTIAVADSLFQGVPQPSALRLWAQNLPLARERTVLESHLERWLSDFWALPAGAALRRVPQTLCNEVRPDRPETWSAKLARSWLALRSASRRRTDHERAWENRAPKTPDHSGREASGRPDDRPPD